MGRFFVKKKKITTRARHNNECKIIEKLFFPDICEKPEKRNRGGKLIRLSTCDGWAEGKESLIQIESDKRNFPLSWKNVKEKKPFSLIFKNLENKNILTILLFIINKINETVKFIEQ